MGEQVNGSVNDVYNAEKTEEFRQSIKPSTTPWVNDVGQWPKRISPAQGGPWVGFVLRLTGQTPEHWDLGGEGEGRGRRGELAVG